MGKKKKEEELEKSSLQKQFTDALPHFLPMIAGGLIGGFETAAATQEGANKAMKQQRDESLMTAKEARELKKLKQADTGIEQKWKKLEQEDARIKQAKSSASTSKERLELQRKQYELSERRFDLAAERSALEGQREQRLAGAQEFREEESELSKYNRLSKDFNSDKVVSGIRQQIAETENAKQLINEAVTNPIAASALPRSLARLSGEVGVMTDQDIADFGGSRALLDRLEQIAEEMMTGKLTDENRQYMDALIDRMGNSAKQRFQDEALVFAGRAEKSFRKTGRKELQNFLMQDVIRERDEQVVKDAAKKKLTKEEVEALMRQRGLKY